VAPAACEPRPLDGHMRQIRTGDLIAVRDGNTAVLFAILTKQILFGGHWSYVFHGNRKSTEVSSSAAAGLGFNAAVDFIVPKRENRVVRISRANDFSSLMGPETLQQEPAHGQVNYQIWRWKDGRRENAAWVRFTPSPTIEEKSAPHYGCIPADWACKLATRRWEPHMSMWVALRD
jgi:hypothetical protein